ncbi:peptidylprolyl isomerase [Candidatus Berkelbacteria bacterium]|nr:peptidylprolyl isomerase [Candidatus Berkelbacteria bacterium]
MKVPLPHLSTSRLPIWVPWVIGILGGGYLLLTVSIGTLLLGGKDSPKLRTAARWVPVPVATVNGQLVWAREYLDYRTFIETFVARSSEAGQAINPNAPVVNQVLNLLISNATIERAAKRAGLVVSSSEIDAAFRDILVLEGGEGGQTRQVSEDELNTILTELYGSSKYKLRDLIRVRLLQDKVQTELLEQVHFRQILVADEARAKDLITKLGAGESFENLAKEHSKHEESRDLGGDMGFVARGQQVEPIETVLFSLPVGLVPDPVKTDFGFHVIEILSKKGTIQQGYDAWLADAERASYTKIFLKMQ